MNAVQEKKYSMKECFKFIEAIMKSERDRNHASNAFTILVPLLILPFTVTIHAQRLVPNPIRAVVSTELEVPWEILEDGGFEAGEREIRTVSPYIDSAPAAPAIEWTEESVHSGARAYKIENGPDTVEFSIWVDPDKAEAITFSCWVRTAAASTSLRPFIVFESTRLVAGPEYGDAHTVDTDWTRVSFTTSSTKGFRFAHAGIEVPPNVILYVDDVSVTVPVWKEPDPTGTVIGGVNVPAEPVAPVSICFSIHIEDPQNLITDEAFFWKKTAVFEELAKLFHDHNGFLNIQPELEWALASERYAPTKLAELAEAYGVTYSTHTHGPVCKGPNGTLYGGGYCEAHHHQPSDHDTRITEQDIATYIQTRRIKFEVLSGIQITDHNGNFDMVDKNLLHTIGVRTLSVFKNEETQRTYDALITNPWRPSNGNALDDISVFLQHNPTGKLIYVPGVGANLTKRHERVSLKVSRFAGQFINYAERERVNAMNLVLHVDAFLPDDPADDLDYIRVQGGGNPSITYSDEFLYHLGCWDDALTQIIDPLVENGYMKWATQTEIAEEFVDWEADQSSIDSVFTTVPSAAGGVEGIAALIRLPDAGRYNGASPVAVHVTGGFSGEGITGMGADLTEQGFIEMFFNFPGSGHPGMKSGGAYDTRGPLSIDALKDVARFAMGLITDKDGNALSDLCGNVTPMAGNVGLVGWSNGGNATLSAAGLHASDLSGLAWIVNWESPVGDGMPGAEAGSKGFIGTGNPETNPAYDPDTGDWDMGMLDYDADIDVNQHQAGQVQGQFLGGFYFDINENGIVDAGVDYVPFPIIVEEESAVKAYYSERITNTAQANGLFPAVVPDHLTLPEACRRFWTVRNGENWFDEIGTDLSHLLFMAVASEEDHVQTALDHPHVLLQYDGLLGSGIPFVRMNPDRAYVGDLIGIDPPDVVDNPANRVFDHLSIRSAVEPADIPGLNVKVMVGAGCCELADRTYYGVLATQLDAVITGSTDAEPDLRVPGDFSLDGYPNPFNPLTTIRFCMPHGGDVRVRVFDILGREQIVLVDGFREAGFHAVTWDAKDAAGTGVGAGVYLVRLDAEAYSQTVRVLYLR